MIKLTESEKKKRKKDYSQKNKDSIRKYQMEYRKKNKDRLKEQSKSYRCKNDSLIKIKKKEYYDKNKDILSSRKKEYYQNNKDRIKKSIYKHRNDNPQKRKLQTLKYREKNRVKIRKASSEYGKNNRVKINTYIENKKKNDTNFRIRLRLRNSVINVLKLYTKNGKIKRADSYGIDYAKIIEHLKPFPKDISKYHLDHIRPLCSFDLTNQDDIKEAFSPQNYQWLTAEENMKKGSQYPYAVTYDQSILNSLEIAA